MLARLARRLLNLALVFVIGVPEILRRAQYASARTLEPFIAYGLAALFYIILTIIKSFISSCFKIDNGVLSVFFYQIAIIHFF